MRKKKDQYDEQTNKKLFKSAENSLITEFVPKLDLFDFQLTENGSNLSAGQRQRIFIARALFKASELAVLDEPTSNLDPNTENKIIQNIFENYKDLAIIMCTHKYSNLDKFDLILNVDKGKLEKVDD